MYEETMNQIHKLANERQLLYRQAGKQSLTAEQIRRLHELNGQLPLLWDRYRREYAARQRPQPAEIPQRIAA